MSIYDWLICQLPPQYKLNQVLLKSLIIQYLSSNRPPMPTDDDEEQKVFQHAQPQSSDIHYQAKGDINCLNFKVKAVVLLVLGVLLAVTKASNNSYHQSRSSAIQLASQTTTSPPSKPSQQTEHIPQQANLNSQATNQLKMQQDNTPTSFIIPKNVWVYADEKDSQTLFVQKCMENIKHFSQASGFTVNLINEHNFNKWTSQRTEKKIKELLQTLRKRMEKESYFYKIKQELISFFVLHQNGGILTSKNLVFTQNFAWINQINSNPYVNRGNYSSLPKYIGFFDINSGSIVEKVKKANVTHEYEKHMIRFPGVDSNFMAAVRKGEFLQLVLEEYSRMMKNPAYLSSIMRTFNLKMGTVGEKDIFHKPFTIACHIVLQIRQFQISNQFEDESKVDNFAIDHFGLFTINNRYFIQKLSNIFQRIFDEKIYRNLAIYSLEELEQTTGPLRYISTVVYQKQFNGHLEDLMIKKKAQLIHPHSFVSKYLLLGKPENDQFLLKTVERSIQNTTAKRWDSLPKIVWLFWNKGIKKASIGNLLCIENLRRNAEKSGFEVREINNSNIEYYIGKDLNERFDRVIQNRKIPTFPQTKSNFVRKAIIHKYGGVYLDVSYFGLESLDWILDIAKYPSQFIFNRYGELPRVLMFFHPHYGQPFSWQYDARANTKRMDLTAYENNFIIAQPNHELFSEWIDEYALTITSDYKDTKARMEKYKVKRHSWTNDNELYLTSMDSLKNVVGRRQNQLNEKAKGKGYKGPWSASQYYGIWSMSGYRGQQKIRIHTNFDNSYYINPQSSDNVFLYRYSQEYTEGILGKANQMIKLYNWNIRHLTELVDRDFDSNFTKEVHPESYCMKYLIAPVRDRIHKNIEILALKDQ